MASFEGLNNINVARLAAVVSFVVGTWATMYWFLCDGHDGTAVGKTPFSVEHKTLHQFWCLEIVLQLFYVLQLFSPDSSVVEKAHGLVWFFARFEILQLVWAYFFGGLHGHHNFIWAWIFAILQVANVVFSPAVRSSSQIKTTSRWWFIHGGAVALPVSWIFYLFWWNGSLALGWTDVSKASVPAILSNIFIWSFPLFGLFLVSQFGDWLAGFVLAEFAFSMWHTQKGLQHIFALVGSIIIAIYSFVVAYPDIPHGRLVRGGSSSERAPLLGGDA
uniref:ARAD1D38192p n=1 Tax=Blastobotrys adeninivorans TaxID=409370 RepID=A0A060TIF5_BLAAD